MQSPNRTCKSPLSFSSAGTCNNADMASPEVIEPVNESSTAQSLGRRRFMHDLHNLSPDEIDCLMSSSGKKNSPRHKYIKLQVRTAHLNCNRWTVSIYWNILMFQITEGRPFLVVHHLPEIKEKGVPYLMPGTPITCRVDNTEKYTTRSKVHLLCLLRTLHTVFTV